LAARGDAGQLDAARRELNARVMGRPGVSGTAIGERGGKPCLKVYVSDAAASGSVPKSVGGFPVVVETTGLFKRL
jgi:hypothetical protein